MSAGSAAEDCLALPEKMDAFGIAVSTSSIVETSYPHAPRAAPRCRVRRMLRRMFCAAVAPHIQVVPNARMAGWSSEPGLIAGS